MVLHFTACSLERTLRLFMSKEAEVSAHIVIDRDGAIYEVVECFGGSAKRAWHAGKSRWEVSRGGDRVPVESFNDRSIGIELVNYNGNIFPYTEAQYASLFAVIECLRGLYPNLSHPESIVGHEQIAGFRGKSDPGRCFEWARLFSVCYPDQGAPERRCVCPQAMAASMGALVAGMGITSDSKTGSVGLPGSLPENFFGLLSSLSESALSRE